MKLSVPVTSFKEVDGILSAQQCAEVIEKLKALPLERWVNRRSMSPVRALNGETCNYLFAADKAMGEDLLKFLLPLAPVMDGYELDEVCINRYDPGHFMGSHIDRGHPRNVVVTLVDNDQQGCLINGVLVGDKAGRAIVHPSISAPHSVPEVKEQRFILIFLYHFKGALQCRHMSALSDELKV